VTKIADATPDFDPVVLFVMRLFLSTAMADYRILPANRTATNDPFCCPIGS
jgi:hypothetical protein